MSASDDALIIGAKKRFQENTADHAVARQLIDRVAALASTLTVVTAVLDYGVNGHNRDTMKNLCRDALAKIERAK